MNKVTELLDAVGGVIICVRNLADSLQVVADVLTDMKSLEVIEAQPVAQISEKAAKLKKKKAKIYTLEDVRGVLAEKSQNGLTSEEMCIRDRMYRTELIVEGVNIFKTKGEKSTMLCKVYSWDKDITESIDAECFIWHRKSSDEEADTEWDKNHIGMKKITITTEDVLDNASFYCEIKL